MGIKPKSPKSQHLSSSDWKSSLLLWSPDLPYSEKLALLLWVQESTHPFWGDIYGTEFFILFFLSYHHLYLSHSNCVFQRQSRNTEVCAFTLFGLLFVCSPSVFPSMALILALSISRKPGKILVPGIWKKRLQTNPWLSAQSQLSLCEHLQPAGHPAASRSWHTKHQAKGFENCLLLFVDKNLLLPMEKPR